MYFLNLRPYRGLLVLVLVLGLAFSAGAVEVSVTAVAAAVPFLQGRWGDGPGEFGLGTDGLGRPSGPGCVAVDSRGRLYIADTHNGRVVRYDRSGRLDSAWNSSWEAGLEERLRPVDIAVDGGGRLFVALSEGTTVLSLDARGLLSGRHETAPPAQDGFRWTLDCIWPDPKAGFRAMVTGQAAGSRTSRIVRFDAGGRMVAADACWDIAAGEGSSSPGAAGVLPEGFCVGSRSEIYVTFRAGPFGVRVERLGRGGTPLWSNLVAGERIIKASALVGGDSKGAYLAVDYGETAQVVFVARQGEALVLAEIAPFRPPAGLSAGAAPYCAMPGRLASGGQLYVISGSSEAFSVDRLTVRRVPRLPWLGRRPALEVVPCR